ncbi:glycine cleavage system aminomethyltransferase GcvT [Parasphaerochaeta coccoides]|uniref:Aminomethyltransferase n=1 Tax=Parasphaerochaeta coccoides (strain ATCC BAA-1237 / DSM 17374 / SPN1) TaxID=760011 RepID=F4GLN4_PARC1|nr:glycine cleavage system aminomethyltransferase GcvT [Parasphaerochaeta coccoides]AEC02428.1 aminomethyltransferase [Parasphaerochaeta coccoides DSM 17374]
MELKTPLYAWHEAHGGRMVSFGGYVLPVQYQDGVIAEHKAVRAHAGLFDISHMAEMTLEGPDALENIQRIFTNDFRNMKKGRVRYTLMCNEKGGILDDLVVCKMDEDRYFMVLNASNRAKDAAWIQEHLEGDVRFTDISDSTALIALQGPAAPAILARLAEPAVIPEKYYTLVEDGRVGDISCIISRTGYTGELGYEFFCAPADAQRLWELLLATGAPDGLVPCGLAARDTLRLEAAMPLYGHEMDEDTTPFQAGLHFAVKMDKGDFIGRNALDGMEAPDVVRVGLEVTSRGIVREHEDIYLGEKKIGHTTSGTMCPGIGKAVAMAYVEKEASAEGTELEADVRGRRIGVKVIALPFYKRT